MQRIQKYKADDGAEFTTEAACLDYEALCAEIAVVNGYTTQTRKNLIDLIGGYLPSEEEEE